MLNVDWDDDIPDKMPVKRAGRRAPKKVRKCEIQKRPALQKVPRKPIMKDVPTAETVLGHIEKHPLPEAADEIRPCKDTILVGSVCSGLCAELWSLNGLGRRFRATFCCENNPSLRELSTSMHTHDYIFCDVFFEDWMAVSCDLFFAGFPCQGYSQCQPAGNGGLKHMSGSCIFPILRYIKHRRPRVFCLENVPGLLTLYPETFAMILGVLDGMTDEKNQKLLL